MTTDHAAAPQTGAQTKQDDNRGPAAPPAVGGTGSGSRLPVDVPAGSRLAHLKAQRDERLKKEIIRLPVPTWKGDLVASFRPMSIEERKDFAKRMGGSDFDEVTVGAGFIAACCTSLQIRSETGDLEPALDESGNAHVFSPSFAHSLGFTSVSTPAGCVQELVNWNVSAIEGLFEKIHEWSKDTSATIEGALLGE